ncbi:MAG: ABC transporter permease subunit, partial [Isosphaeraceae bacterium]
MMVLGPVFHFELLRIARRWWLYAIRFGFGLLLLLLLSFNFLAFFDLQKPWKFLTTPPPLSIRELALFGRSIFYTIMAAQGIMVCLLTPGLVADAIAGERQRKTLHYLMNTRIWAGEIVLGKLASRMLHLAIFVAVTLPIVSLLTLMGGIDPVLLGWSYGATFSTGFLLASLGIFASATIRRPRDALLASYLYAALVLAGPTILSGLLSTIPAGWWSPAIDAVRDAISWPELLSPISLITQS